ncbi:MAG: transcriptional repressor [Verrucomicrobia bacterium]|nr:transcriptional repressor [Verrucomicrobiota bacterium]
MKPHVHQERLSELNEKLRQKSRKVTAPRQAILDVLRKHRHPLTNKEIFAVLPPGECDLATIYRSMHMLESMRMVQRFDFGDGTARYELICEGDDGHHHHLICTRCSEVLEIEDCFPVALEKKLAEDSGFKFVTHKLEFFGVCPKCQGK